MNDKITESPQIRFAGFTDAWEQRKLGEIATLGSSKRIHLSDYVPKGIPFYRGSEISTGGITGQQELFISENLYQEIKEKYGVPQENDLLVTAVGTLGNIWKVDGRKFYYKDGNLIQISKLKANSDYILSYFNDGVGKRRLLDSAAGSNQKALTMVKMREITLPLPKEDEQTQIGTLFKNLVQLITLHQRKLELLKDTKKSLLQKMFPKDGANVPEIRFKGFSDAWEQRELGEIGETFTGLSGKTKEDFGHGDAKFVTYMNVFSNPIADPNWTENVEIDNKQREVKYGDVFFTTSSETPEEVGMSSVWLENTANVYLNSFCFGYRPTVEFDPYYLAFMLRSPVVRKKFIFLAQGISRYNISKSKVMEMVVLIPSLNEQKSVGEFFKNLDNLITLHQGELNSLENLQKSLLQLIFI